MDHAVPTLITLTEFKLVESSGRTLAVELFIGNFTDDRAAVDAITTVVARRRDRVVAKVLDDIHALETPTGALISATAEKPRQRLEAYICRLRDVAPSLAQDSRSYQVYVAPTLDLEFHIIHTVFNHAYDFTKEEQE